MQKAAAESGRGHSFPNQEFTMVNQERSRLLSRQWKIIVRGKTVNVRDQLDSILKILQAFKGIGSAAADLEPVLAGLPWAGVFLIMQLASSDSDQYASMVADIEGVACTLSLPTDRGHFASEQATY